MRQIACFVLYDTHQRVLVQHRTDDAPWFPGKWCLFGGGIESYDETPACAAVREAKEELGYALQNHKQVLVRDWRAEGIDGRTFLFIEKYDGSPVSLFEGKGMGWFMVSELGNLDMVLHDRKMLESISDLLV